MGKELVIKHACKNKQGFLINLFHNVQDPNIHVPKVPNHSQSNPLMVNSSVINTIFNRLKKKQKHKHKQAFFRFRVIPKLGYKQKKHLMGTRVSHESFLLGPPLKKRSPDSTKKINIPSPIFFFFWLNNCFNSRKRTKHRGLLRGRKEMSH